jgi:hypothetical protein
MVMKRLIGLIAVLCLMLVNYTYGQTNVNSAGNWDNSGIWSAGIANSVSTNVTMTQNIGTINFPNSTSYSTTYNIGNMDMSNGNTLDVQSTGSPKLILGASGNPKSLTTNNNTTIRVRNGATLEIWGDLIVNNNLTFLGSGHIIVHGNFTMNNGGSVAITGGGDLSVGGNFTGGSNTSISVSGSSSTITVSGALNVGNGTSSITVSGTGSYISAGSCSCGGCGGTTGCGNVSVPITLSAFTANVSGDAVEIKWSTSSEINFDYFSLQKSDNGVVFKEIAQVKGHGTTSEAHSYSFDDINPFVGRSYYRLTSNDFDGYQETFRTVSVEYHGGKKFYVSPNPADGASIRLYYNFDTDVDGTVTVYDNLGFVVGSYSAGTESIVFANALKSGVYLAKYSSSSFTKTERFFVK